MASFDRRMIAALMLPHFPTMADTEEHRFTSDEWHGFMNARTGLNVPLLEPNTSAFDKWRKALAAQDIPVWNYTASQITEIDRRGKELKAKEDARVAVLSGTLELLAKLAPTKTPEQLIADTRKANA